MLTILNDPTGATGVHRHPWDHAASIQANIERHLAHGGDCQLRLNGELIDPGEDPRMERAPTALDAVTVVQRPGEIGFWTMVAIAVGSAVIALALMPKLPGVNTGKDSPNNSLTGQTNVARAYQAIPDVYGYRRVWPDLIQPSTVEYIDHIKYVTEWLCVSRGLGTITDVQYADTPIADISGASFEVFEPDGVTGYPETWDTTLSDVVETFESAEVNGQELAYPDVAATFTRTGTLAATMGDAFFTLTIPDGDYLDILKGLTPTGTAAVEFEYGAGPLSFAETCTVLSTSVLSGNCTITFSSSVWAANQSGTVTASVTPNFTGYTAIGPFTLALDCDQLRWNTVFLRGLKGSVVIRAEWWQIDSSGVEISGTREQQDDTYTADTYDQRFWTTQVEPAAGLGRYRVQFTRQTNQIGDQGTDVAKLEELYAVRTYATKVLPGVTVIRVTTKATTEATGYSERKFNLRWLRHVRELDSDTLGPSRNFARAMAHIWTLAGNDIGQLDTDKLQAINTEFGEDSPLLRYDASLDDADMSLGERLQQAANHARCLVWRDGTRWTVTREQARDYPEMQLDYRNLAADGESAIGYAAHLPASNDGVEIEHVDEATQAKKAYVRLRIVDGVVETGPARNPKKLQLPGCTSTAQATNRAHLEARRLLYQRVSVQDTALSDAWELGLGSLARWVDPNDLAGDDGLQAGEVLAVAGTLITTSEPVDWRGETTGRILLTGDDGRFLGSPIVCTPGSGGAINLASVPAGLFLADDDRQCGSRYAFSPGGLSAAEVEAAGLYTATEIKPAGDGTVSISLVEYDARMFEMD